MSVQFKKVYVEITNVCNLSCPFCIGNKRRKEFMTMDNFKIILNKLQGYTKYLYLHVMGEPLMHPNINEMIDEASENYFVNLTTNGYLIEKIKDNKNIRQVNVSLHDFVEGCGVSFDDYMTSVCDTVLKLADRGTYVALRMWRRSPLKEQIVSKINDYFGSRICGDLAMKVRDNVFFEVEHEFVWPELSGEYYSEEGTCYGTRKLFGILVSGDVVPCCLDSEGIIRLGNIYNEELSDIIGSELFVKMQQGFRNNKKVCELCRHCSFINR